MECPLGNIMLSRSFHGEGSSTFVSLISRTFLGWTRFTFKAEAKDRKIVVSASESEVRFKVPVNVKPLAERTHITRLVKDNSRQGR